MPSPRPDPETRTVELASVEAAIQLTSYFKGQVRRVEHLFPRQASRIEGCRNEIQRKLSVCRYHKRTLQKNSAYSAEIFNPAFDSMLSPEIQIDRQGMVSLTVSNN